MIVLVFISWWMIVVLFRQKFGVCPQHDIIWPDLSPYEHLMLIAKLKGVPPYSAFLRHLSLLLAFSFFDNEMA